MCGILGAVGSACNDLDERKFIDALDLIRRRGPDSGAVWQNKKIWFGHRRLAIVDVTQQADQPMLSGDLALVFNGEIYNHRELRSELQALGHHFDSVSDTEVLLHAWKQWGKGCLKRLEGMFAFAMWDQRVSRLTLVRDRFGEKPLFIHRRLGGVAFSSEMTPLIRLANGALTEDAAAIGMFFLYSYIPAPHSAFKDLEQLAPGCYLEWSSTGEVHHGRYYDLHIAVENATQAPQPKYEDAVVQLRDRLADSVRLRVASADVPVATLLSGGIDSSIITTLAASVSGEKLTAYSLGFPEEPDFDESVYAREVADNLPNVRHNLVEVTEGDLLDFSSHVLDHLGEPFADASILPTSFLCSRVEEKVVLGGDAADEIFAGYGVYPAILRGAAMPDILRSFLCSIPQFGNPSSIRHPTLRAAALFHVHLRNNALDSYLSWRTYAKLTTLGNLDIDCSKVDSVRELINGKFVSSLRGIQAMDIEFNLPNDMLKKVDYASMTHGLEIRTPFLDSELVSWALSLPDSYKLSRGVRKRILRDAFNDVLPWRIMNRRKMGFLLPIRQWFRDGQLRGELEVLLTEQTRFDRTVVNKLIAEHAMGAVDHSVLLWSVYVYLRWRNRLNIWGTHNASEFDRMSVSIIKANIH